MEVMELIRQDVRIRDEIEHISAEPLLHLHVVKTKPVLPRDLIRLREMVYSLVLIQTLVQIGLATGRRPQDVPLV